ncbi:MAG: EAL and HDOD domain-containing protein [Chloroflexota bacterium]
MLSQLPVLARGVTPYLSFTRALLLADDARLIPSKGTVVQLNRAVGRDDSVLRACDRFKRHGVLIAIDDFQIDCAGEPLLTLAHQLHVDLKKWGSSEWWVASDIAKRNELTLVARNVDSWELVSALRRFGFIHFEGLLTGTSGFASGAAQPPTIPDCLEMLSALASAGGDQPAIEESITRNQERSRAVLAMINSPAAAVSRPIESVGQALKLIGANSVRKWASVVALRLLAHERTTELIIAALVRGGLCETLAQAVGLESGRHELFVLGLCSRLDVISGQPMKSLAGQLPLQDELRAALFGEDSASGHILSITQAFESADWKELAVLCEKAGITLDACAQAYSRAIAQADAIFRFWRASDAC